MLISGIEPTLNTDPWRYQQHLEIWVLIIGLVVAFVYAIRVLGPKVVPSGEVISRKQIRTFSLMIFLLLISTDWPLHDIAEEYLYSMHMLQHTILTYIIPPLALLATPEWLFRLLVGKGRTYRVIHAPGDCRCHIQRGLADYSYSCTGESFCSWWSIALQPSCFIGIQCSNAVDTNMRPGERMAYE